MPDETTERLERLQAMIGQSPSGMTKLLGITVVALEPGRAVVRCTPGEQHGNTRGTTHGGLAAAMIDTATGAAVITTLEDGESTATVDLNVKYVRRVRPDGGPIDCEATVVHRGRRMATIDAKITDGDGRLLSHGSATMIVRSKDAS
ncbi:MAG: PaaI family thioesterase [Sphingomonadales bacterium]|nr:PaaI family thioesterase [Sphingomonadales bacterium]